MFKFINNFLNGKEPEKEPVQEENTTEVVSTEVEVYKSDRPVRSSKRSRINIAKQMVPMRDTLCSAFILIGADKNARQQLDKSIAEYLVYATKLQDHHGPQSATKQLKALNQMVLHWLTAQAVEQLGPVNMKLHKSGKPACVATHLPTLDKLLDSEEQIQKRIALSVLRGFELVRGDPEYNTDTISGVTNGAFNYTTVKLNHPLIKEEFNGQVFRDLFIEFLQSSRYGNLKRKLYTKAKADTIKRNEKSTSSLYYTSKASPRGFAVGTLGSQSKDIGPRLKDVLSLYAERFGLNTYKKELESNQSFASANTGQVDVNITGGYYGVIPEGCLGRLCVYPDKGWKHRLMAICNTWVQVALKPAHETLMEVLKSIPTDGSWDQERAASRVKLASVNKSITSKDIQDATNLIPAVMQEDSLLAMDLTFQNWRSLVQGMHFFHPEIEVSLQYKTGQPMGLYTSFAALAHWHNDIYQFSNYLHKGKLNEIFQDYQVLGDDSVCWDTEVSTVYQYLLTTLEVPVSEGKSFAPVIPGTKPNVAEFAKRIFVNGYELTGLSPTLCASVYGRKADCSLEYMPSLWLNVLSKGWVSNSCLLTFEAFKQSIKHSAPLTGQKRLKALFILCKISMLSALPIEDSEPGIKDQAIASLLEDLVDEKVYDIQCRLGPVWSQIPTLRGKLLNESHSGLAASPPYEYYTFAVIDLVLKDLNRLYERAALSIKSRDTLTMLEYVMDYQEVQDVRKLDASSIFSKPTNSVRRNKREKAQSALYKLIYATVNQ